MAKPPIQPFPFQQADFQPETQPERYMSLPTVEVLKRTSLFGLPLKSAFTGQEIPDETLEDFIKQAISSLEHELNIFITPVAFEDRYDFDKKLFFHSYAWQKLNNGPILTVDEVSLDFTSFVKENSKIVFPNDFVVIQAQDSAIQLVPTIGGTLSGFLISVFSGNHYAAVFASGLTRFPGAYRVKYTAGFLPDKVPALISALIEKKAAYLALGAIGHLLFPFQSNSVSLDGVSQSVSNAGPQYLVNRIQNLQEQIERDMEAARGYYQRKIILDFI
jgi:hypothetical protein